MIYCFTKVYWAVIQRLCNKYFLCLNLHFKLDLSQLTNFRPLSARHAALLSGESALLVDSEIEIATCHWDAAGSEAEGGRGGWDRGSKNLKFKPKESTVDSD